jgi:hypothetical protein
MSINFSAKVKVCVSYLDQDDVTWTRPFEQVESTLDLGTHRALRSICPLDKVTGCIEDCGSLKTDGHGALIWLDNAHANCGPQVKWAMEYLSAACGHVAEYMREEMERYNNNPQTKQTIEVEVSWG